MTLSPQQLTWLNTFGQAAVEQSDHDRDAALREVHLARLRKALRAFRTEFKNAFDIAVASRGKTLGNLLEKGGTQLDEVDMADFVASQQQAKGDAADAARAMTQRATAFLAEWTEQLKRLRPYPDPRLSSTSSASSLSDLSGTFL